MSQVMVLEQEMWKLLRWQQWLPGGHKEGRKVAGGSSQPCVHSEVG